MEESIQWLFLSKGMLAVLIIGSILGLTFCILLIMGRKYKQYIEPLDEKEFPAHELYGVGFVILDLIHYKYTSKKDRSRRKEIELIYDSKFSEYYLRIITAQRITLSYLVLILGFVLTAIENEIAMLFIGFMFSFVCFYYFGTKVSNRIKKKTDNILKDFPEIVSKLALLVNAGMIIKEAWEKVGNSGEGVIYEEMRITSSEINNGLSETEAYINFGNRCVLADIKKFTSMLLQGQLKGNQELSIMMRQQSKEMWDQRKQYAKQQGEKAANKLMIPICMIFIGILIMVIVPIFGNISNM